MTPIHRIGPTLWSYLQAHALGEPDGACHPVTLNPWAGRSPLRPGPADLADWEYIARCAGSPRPEAPYSMAIGLAGERPVGFVESSAPTPATCAAGAALLREAGATQIITVCRPTPGGVLHVRSLMASLWWERDGLPTSHTYLGPETHRPLPFAWPEGGLAPAPAGELRVVRNPELTPEQAAVTRWLQEDPAAPLRYAAFLGDWPVCVANVIHGPLEGFGSDATARWSAGEQEPVCRIKWIASLLMGGGIGSALVARIEADARQAGLSSIVLEAAPFTTTDRFWSRLGFRMVERDPHVPYRYMEKRLEPVAPQLSA
ncbi:MAG: GNAT family N-acetyltransferase [Bacillota bacterium]